MRVFRLYTNQKLNDPRTGALLASGGESIAADHPAVLALEDTGVLGFFADDAPVKVDADGIPIHDEPAAPEPVAPVVPTRRTFGFNDSGRIKSTEAES